MIGGIRLDMTDRRRLPVWTACVLFLLVSTTVTVVGRDERSGWTLMTSPAGHDHRSNTLLGFCWLRGGRPFMKENIPCVSQVGLFAGSRSALSDSEYRDDFRLIRGFHGFSASFLAPLLGVVPALIAVNWLSWAGCVAVAYDLTRRLSGDGFTAALAAALATFGTGPILHVGDYSPHLLAFATYSVGIWLLVRTRIYEKERPCRVHLGLGLYFAISCLTYNTGVMLLAVYGIAAAARNRWRNLAAAGVIALSARPLWQAILGPSVADVEAEYLSRALGKWQEILAGEPVTALRLASEIVFSFDSPGIVIVGLFCCLLFPMPAARRRLGLATVAVPFLAAFVFSPAAGARGYLVYAGSVWVYYCLASALAAGLRGPRLPLRTFTAAAALALIGSQAAWATAHFVGRLGPAKTYFLGWDDGLPYFGPPTEAASLTGREPAPVLFGGAASLAEAGAVTDPENRPISRDQVSFFFASASRGFFGLYLLALALAVPTCRRRRGIAVASLCGALAVTGWLSTQTLRSVPAFFPVDRAVTIPAGGTLRYVVSLSRDSIHRLADLTGPADTLGLFIKPYTPSALDVSIFVDDRKLSVERDPDPEYRNFYRLKGVDSAGANPPMTEVESLVVEITNPSDAPVALAGWQRPDLPARRLTISVPEETETDPPPALPALELRLADPRGRLKFAAF